MSEGAGTVVRTQTDVRVRPSPLPPRRASTCHGWLTRGVGEAGTRRPAVSIGHTVFELEEVIQHPRPTASLLGTPARAGADPVTNPVHRGGDNTHDQTSHDAPRTRRGARERLAGGAGLHGRGTRGADRPRPPLSLRLASGDLADQAAHPMRRPQVGQPRNAEAGHLGSALRVQAQPARLQLERVRRALPAVDVALARTCRPLGTGRSVGVQRESEHRLHPDGTRPGGSWSPWAGCA